MLHTSPLFLHGACSSRAHIILSEVTRSWQHLFLVVCGVTLFSCTHTIASITLQGFVIWQVSHLFISYLSS